MTTRARSTQPRSGASTTTLASLLLQAMGLGAGAVVALGASACGGKVFVDLPGGEGGAGGAGGGTPGSSSSGGVFTCDYEPKYTLELTCLESTTPAEGCPAASDSAVVQEITFILEDLGCGGADIASVPCGPDPGNTQECCYFADAIIYECGGRPFTSEGAPITAEAARRADWIDRAARADRDAIDPETRRALAEAWTRDALDEHASIASFARFTLELLAAGAPSDVLDRAQRATGDEIRHARLCFSLASGYAGRDVGPSSLPIQAAGAPRASLADIAAAVVREGCVGETIAAYVAAVARDAATDPDVRAALSVIARDEAEHAALAYRFAAWAAAHGGDEVARAIEAAFDEAIASPPCRSAAPIAGDPAVLRAHGQLSPEERRDATIRCLAGVVAPCARALRSSGAGPAAVEASA